MSRPRHSRLCLPPWSLLSTPCDPPSRLLAPSVHRCSSVHRKLRFIVAARPKNASKKLLGDARKRPCQASSGRSKTCSGTTFCLQCPKNWPTVKKLLPQRILGQTRAREEGKSARTGATHVARAVRL